MKAPAFSSAARSSAPDASRSVVWAIDPYQATEPEHRGLAHYLEQLRPSYQGRILPFSVVSPAASKFPLPVSHELGQRLSALGRAAVAERLATEVSPALDAPTIEVHESCAKRELVRSTLRFARDHGAGLIAVATRQPHRDFPFHLGGFAEAILGESTLPILTVNPHAVVPTQIRRIVMASDLTPRSRRAFHYAAHLAARLHAELVLLTVFPHVEVPFGYADLGFPLDDLYESARAAERSKRAVAARWRKRARALGAHCRVHEENESHDLARSILAAAEREAADLICLASYREGRRHALLGGTVRHVVSVAPIPVLEIPALHRS